MKIRTKRIIAVISAVCISLTTGCDSMILSSLDLDKARVSNSKEKLSEKEKKINYSLTDSEDDKYRIGGNSAFYLLRENCPAKTSLIDFKVIGMSIIENQHVMFYAYQALDNNNDYKSEPNTGTALAVVKKEDLVSVQNTESSNTQSGVQKASADSGFDTQNYANYKVKTAGTASEESASGSGTSDTVKKTGSGDAETTAPGTTAAEAKQVMSTVFMSYNIEKHIYKVYVHEREEYDPTVMKPLMFGVSTTAGKRGNKKNQNDYTGFSAHQVYLSNGQRVYFFYYNSYVTECDASNGQMMYHSDIRTPVQTQLTAIKQEYQDDHPDNEVVQTIKDVIPDYNNYFYMMIQMETKSKSSAAESGNKSADEVENESSIQQYYIKSFSADFTANLADYNYAKSSSNGKSQAYRYFIQAYQAHNAVNDSLAYIDPYEEYADYDDVVSPTEPIKDTGEFNYNVFVSESSYADMIIKMFISTFKDRTITADENTINDTITYKPEFDPEDNDDDIDGNFKPFYYINNRFSLQLFRFSDGDAAWMNAFFKDGSNAFADNAQKTFKDNEKGTPYHFSYAYNFPSFISSGMTSRFGATMEKDTNSLTPATYIFPYMPCETKNWPDWPVMVPVYQSYKCPYKLKVSDTKIEDRVAHLKLITKVLLFFPNGKTQLSKSGSCNDSTYIQSPGSNLIEYSTERVKNDKTNKYERVTNVSWSVDFVNGNNLSLKKKIDDNIKGLNIYYNDEIKNSNVLSNTPNHVPVLVGYSDQYIHMFIQFAMNINQQLCPAPASTVLTIVADKKDLAFGLGLGDADGSKLTLNLLKSQINASETQTEDTKQLTGDSTLNDSIQAAPKDRNTETYGESSGYFSLKDSSLYLVGLNNGLLKVNLRNPKYSCQISPYPYFAIWNSSEDAVHPTAYVLGYQTTDYGYEPLDLFGAKLYTVQLMDEDAATNGMLSALGKHPEYVNDWDNTIAKLGFNRPELLGKLNKYKEFLLDGKDNRIQAINDFFKLSGIAKDTFDMNSLLKCQYGSEIEQVIADYYVSRNKYEALILKYGDNAKGKDAKNTAEGSAAAEETLGASAADNGTSQPQSTQASGSSGKTDNPVQATLPSDVSMGALETTTIALDTQKVSEAVDSQNSESSILINVRNASIRKYNESLAEADKKSLSLTDADWRRDLNTIAYYMQIPDTLSGYYRRKAVYTYAIELMNVDITAVLEAQLYQCKSKADIEEMIAESVTTLPDPNEADDTDVNERAAKQKELQAERTKMIADTIAGLKNQYNAGTKNNAAVRLSGYSNGDENGEALTWDGRINQIMLNLQKARENEE